MTKYIYKELEIVQLRKTINEHLLEGAKGTIVFVYDNSQECPTFEVEFQVNGGCVMTLTSKDIAPTYEKLIIECGCLSHMLKVVNYVDENNEQEVYFAMFSYGNYRRSLWRRIKLAWKMIWKDEVYDDQLIFNRNEANKLREFLNRIL